MTEANTARKPILKYLKSLPECSVDTIHGNEYQSSISDILVCYKGHYIALETKAPNGNPDPGQRAFLRRVQRARGIGEVVRGVAKVRSIIDAIDQNIPWVNTTY